MEDNLFDTHTEQKKTKANKEIQKSKMKWSEKYIEFYRERQQKKNWENNEINDKKEEIKNAQ